MNLKLGSPVGFPGNLLYIFGAIKGNLGINIVKEQKMKRDEMDRAFLKGLGFILVFMAISMLVIILVT